MKSNEERIELMHKKAEKLRHERNMRLMAVSGSVFALLFIVLVVASMKVETQVADHAEATFAASSLFAVSIGAYVIVAVIAFMVGAAITVLIKKYMRRNGDEEKVKK